MRKLLYKRHKLIGNKGFSLVELIIVIAIMAVLMAVLAPQLIKYVEKSRVAADNAFADSLKSTVGVFLSDDTYSATVNGDFTVQWKANAVTITATALDAAAQKVITDYLAETLGSDYATHVIKSNTYKSDTYSIPVSFSTKAGVITNAKWATQP